MLLKFIEDKLDGILSKHLFDDSPSFLDDRGLRNYPKSTPKSLRLSSKSDN